jgi:hypothetical protein
MAIDRLTLCVAISSIISTISLIEKSGMEVGLMEWMSSPFQRYVKYPALIACAVIFLSPRWGKQEEATGKAASSGGGDKVSKTVDGEANASRSGSRGTASGSVVGSGGGGSKKKRAKAMRNR